MRNYIKGNVVSMYLFCLKIVKNLKIVGKSHKRAHLPNKL